MGQNMVEAINAELQRNREILRLYEQCPTGQFGAICIRGVIQEGERALHSMEAVDMVRALAGLRETK